MFATKRASVLQLYDKPEDWGVNRLGHQGLFYERFYGPIGGPPAPPLSAPALVAADPAAGVPAGLYHNRNRWYSPDLGRFVQRDMNETALPILAVLAMNGAALDAFLSGFEPVGHYGDGLNLYLYAGANPLTRRDALGLDWHHFYPQYLGGNSDGPGVWLSSSDHTTFHATLKNSLGDGTPEAQRRVWLTLGEKERKRRLTLAAQASGLDVDSNEFKNLLQKSYQAAKKHGVAVEWAKMKPGNHYRVPRCCGGPRRIATAKIPGTSKLRAVARGTAAASGVVTAASLLALTDITNTNLLELARATVRARENGGLRLWDEAFALYDFYELTGESFSAGYAWLEWSEGL